MRFIHLADLHLGRSLEKISLLDVQRDFLNKIVVYSAEHAVDAVVIAGDVYDRSIPPVEATELLSEFISRLSAAGTRVLMVPGNHDSAERLSFLNSILSEKGVHIAGDYRLGQPAVELEDAHGLVCFHLLPFFRPITIRQQLEDSEESISYDEAVRIAVESMPIDLGKRNVLVGHQLVMALGEVPERSESEVLNIGTAESVRAEHFKKFDYVALGHLHRPQRVGEDSVRYAGSPLKYSASECGTDKTFVVVELKAKGSIEIELVRIVPLRDVRVLRGDLKSLLSEDYVRAGNAQDYIYVRLTDEVPVEGVMDKLRTRYPNLVQARWEALEKANRSEVESVRHWRQKPMDELFAEFFDAVHHREMNDEEKQLLADVVSGIEKGEGK